MKKRLNVVVVSRSKETRGRVLTSLRKNLGHVVCTAESLPGETALTTSLLAHAADVVISDASSEWLVRLELQLEHWRTFPKPLHITTDEYAIDDLSMAAQILGRYRLSTMCRLIFNVFRPSDPIRDRIDQSGRFEPGVKAK